MIGERAAELAWLQGLPKCELHLHLEGAIPHESLWRLVEKYGGDPSLPDIEALRARFVYRDFPHFIETWVWKNGFLREYEDFTFIAEAVARDLAAQNIRYAEVFYSPGDFAGAGLEPGPLTEAVRKGLDGVAELRVQLVADLIRDFGPERGARVLDAVNEARGLGVVGIGIGGSEHDFPPEPFAAIYERARELGFKTSAHAGEAAGPESVWGALRALRVDRVGHGTRAAEDPTLVEHLASRAIPVEICVLSNLRTGVVASLGEHPVRRFFDAGVPLSINTDDPKMFGNALAQEYLALREELGFTREEVLALMRQAIDCAWLPPEDRTELLVNLEAASSPSPSLDS